MLRFSNICALLLAVLLMGGCRKPTNANWDVDVVVPLVHSHLSIKNFIGDSIFKADQNGLLNLNVTREITAVKLDSLVELPDTSISKSFTLPVIGGLKVAPGQNLPFFPPVELTFDISNGVALKYVDMRSGSITLKFTNNAAQPLNMLYILPGVFKNYMPFTVSETIPPGVNSLTKTYDLAGYHFNMQGLSGFKYNTISQTYTIAVSPTASDSVRLNPGIITIANIDITYSKLVPDYVEGYFGQQTINIAQDTAKLNLLNNFRATNFMLSDATLDFKIMNEFGAEFTGSLANVKSINTNTATNSTVIVPLTTTQISNLDINRATRAGSTVFPSIKNTSLTAVNSNIVPFLSNLPDKLSYKGSIQVNPLGNTWGYSDFAYYGKGIRVLADINIPMRFNADNFKLISHTPVDFSNLEQLDNVKSGNFVIQATNGYPFKAMLQAYLLNEQKQVIDSLFIPGQNVIDHGLLDSQNMVTAPVSSKVLVPISSSKIATMRKSKSIQIITYFLMPPNPPDIRLQDSYQIDVSIIAELNYNVVRK